jgi:hypothetical protein
MDMEMDMVRFYDTDTKRSLKSISISIGEPYPLQIGRSYQYPYWRQ